MRAPAPTITTILVACLAAFSLSACAPPAPEPSPTPTGFASEEEAFAAAEETYRAYVDAANAVNLADPRTFEPVFELLGGEAESAARKSFSQMHADGWSVSGKSRIIEVDHSRFDGELEQAELAVCVDVSDVLVRNAQGDSLVEDRPDVQALNVLVEDTAGAVGPLITEFASRPGEDEC